MLPWSKIVGRGKISSILQTVDSVGLTERLNMGQGREGSIPTGTNGSIVMSFIKIGNVAVESLMKQITEFGSGHIRGLWDTQI